MSNIINFIAQDQYAYDVCPRPFPASNAIPKWWKDSTPYSIDSNNPDGKKIIIENFESNASFKKCTPMLDALTSGYIFPLWADVQIRQENDMPYITWRVSRNVFEIHGQDSSKVESPEGYYEVAFKYMNYWHIKTPKGYSTLITHPFGYQKLPFKTITAVIDTDMTTHPIVVPLWIKNNFEGILETGTPMFQAIPFKRSDWKSEFSKYENGRYERLFDKNVKATIVNNYVKSFWEKKNYR